jgi:hypothetical protein
MWQSHLEWYSLYIKAKYSKTIKYKLETSGNQMKTIQFQLD